MQRSNPLLLSSSFHWFFFFNFPHTFVIAYQAIWVVGPVRCATQVIEYALLKGRKLFQAGSCSNP